LLIADEVGLGKTIEAGIIITEQSARVGELPRVLVVCPAMLRNKWKVELWRRFRQEFDVLDQKAFSGFLDRYVEYGAAEQLRAICSIQALRSSRVIDRLLEIRPHFDIVIVDEAHYLKNPESVSRDLGEVLCELADAVLFLSATPLQLGTNDLFTLLNLLVPGEFTDPLLFSRMLEPNEFINNAIRLLREPRKAAAMLQKVEDTSQAARFINNPFYKQALSILDGKEQLTRGQAIEAQGLLIELTTISHVFSRTKKRDVAIKFPKREARVVKVRFTAAEKEFYDAVTEFCVQQFSARQAGGQGLSFAVIMPQRQVSSCIPAMRDKLEQILRTSAVRGPGGDDGDVIDPEAEEGALWKLDGNEMRALEKLRQAAQRLGQTDTKFDAFLKALHELEQESPGCKIIVFSFFKSTLGYLKNRLESTGYGGRIRMIHGDIADKERQKTIAKFRSDGETRILLTSEVGSEGLDFEFCNVLFNYDLPWNPMRIEQRIGRLDRYGQQHEKILIFNFSMDGTIDDEILNRLYRRIGIFERYIGDLEAILGNQITELTRELFNVRLSAEERAKIIDKVAENLERRRVEQERFEKEGAKFIGQDEYFDREVTRTLETKRFITATEVEFLLRTFLARQHPNTTLLPPKTGRPGLYVLKADENFRRLVWRFTDREETRLRTDRELANPYLVTFNSDIARQEEGLGFITIHHPIIRAIKKFYDENPDFVAMTGSLMLKGRPADAGSYLFLVYLLEKAGLKVDLEMVPILIQRATGKVSLLSDPLVEWFMAELPNATDAVKAVQASDPGWIDSAIQEGMEYIALLRSEEEEKLRQRNEALVQNQAESLRQATQLKIEKAKETITKLRLGGQEEDSNIVRLYRSRIRNLEMGLDERLRVLDAKRSATVSFGLIAGGFLEITA
jgi:superfamily II DNA/RNA helicase